MFVIGVAGQRRMGKDTLADRLCEKLNERAEKMCWQRAAFAGNVKKVFENTFGVSRDFVEEWKVRDEAPEGFDLPVRKSLQFIGDGFRKIKGEIWIDLCFRGNQPRIISDVRYINEFKRVKKEGGLNILIGRPDVMNNDPCGSEAQIKPYVEWALNNWRDDSPSMIHISRVLGSTMTNLETGRQAPEFMNQFDYFVRNDGSLEELHDKIDNELIPFVGKFAFSFES